MSEEPEGSPKQSEESQSTKRDRFVYKPRHLVLLLRQVAADNPFQHASTSQQLKVWETIGAALKDVGITAQVRSSQLKVEKMLDDQDKRMNKPPKSGTEEECTELKQLLEELALLRKEEAKRHAEEAKQAKALPAAKKPVRLPKGNTEVQQGKSIRDASLTTMKRRRENDASSTEEGTTDEEEHEMNAALGIDTRNPNRKLQHGVEDVERFKRYSKPTGSDKLVNVLSTSAKAEQEYGVLKLEFQNRQLDFQERQLEEQKAAREQAAAIRAQELELEKMKTKARFKTEQEKDALLTTVLKQMIAKLP